MPGRSRVSVSGGVTFCAAVVILLTPHPLAAQHSDSVAADSQGQISPDAEVIPSETTLKNWVLSGDPRLVAWAAQDALAARDRNLIPDLLSLAAQWEPLSRPVSEASAPTKLSPGQTDDRDAMLSVLDALIQMNVPIPADTLRTLAPDFGNAVAVLLSRMSPEDSGLLSLEFYRSPTDHDYGLQYVSAALLSLHPALGFAADLVSNIRVNAYLHVVLPGSKPEGMGFAACCGPSPEAPRDDWPAIGQYALTKEKSGGAVVLVAGIDPIYTLRRQSPQYLGDCSMSLGATLGPEERVRLVAEMLNTPPEAIAWQVQPVTTIEFQSLQQFDADLLSFIEEQQTKHRATVEALSARGLLTPAEAEQCLPALTLHLIDDRGQDTAPIPKRSDLPPHVEWSRLPL